jgi:hypothetical protein
MTSKQPIWRVVYDQGYGRPQTVDEYEVEVEAFKAARSLSGKYLNVSIEDPRGQLYDEVAITDWFQRSEKHPTR